MTQTATPNVQDLAIVRVFDAPVSAVWRAWSEAEVVMRWWGPTGFSCPSCRMDFREGGTTLVCMRAPPAFGGQDMYSTWRYVAIKPLRRIEYIHNLSDQDANAVDPAALGMPPDFPSDQRHAIEFKARGANQAELVVTEYGWTVGRMMEMSKLGMEQCLDKMAEAIRASSAAAGTG